MTAVSERRDAPFAGVPGSRTGSPARAHPGAVLALIAAGAAAALLLWWHGTPSLHGFGDWLTNAGRITGLEAGYGVVGLVALMARIPPRERGVGADRLARWHSTGGSYTICGRRPGSSSAGGSSPATWGGHRPRTRCPRRPGPAGCASPPKRPATTAAPCAGSSRAPGSSPRARTVR